MTQVSPIRLWVMRAMYLFMAAGIGATIWPLIVTHSVDTGHMTGVAWALLGTIGLLSLLGLRYPLQMIPILLLELTWKLVWLAAFALPAWRAGALTEGIRTSVFETSFGLILLLVIPWRYVWANYVAKPGEPWAVRTGAGAAGGQHA